MPNHSTGDPSPPERPPGSDRTDGERRSQRRERQRRRLRRRRLLSLGALAIAVVVAIALLALSGEEPGPGPRAQIASGERGAGAADGKRRPGGSAGAVRNASPRPNWRRHTGPVPIVEYHVLGVAPADAPYPELYVSRPDFRGQMAWLDRHGFEAVTLEQVQDAWHRGATLPPKPVVIAFDDGYRPQFTFALPVLRKHGWAGVLSLKAEGSDLYRSNVEAMLEAGWELASHTIDHADLTTLDAAALRREVAGSRRILQREYGAPVRNFCYPAGRFDETVVAAVEAAGYEGAMSQIPGFAERDRPYELARLEILGSDGIEGFAARLGSG